MRLRWCGARSWCVSRVWRSAGAAAHRAQAHDTYDERHASVGSYLRKVARGRQLVVSDVNLSLLATTQALVRGPTLFQYHNLLAAVPTLTDTQDHTLCFAIFGTRTCDIAAAAGRHATRGVGF